MRFFFLVFAFIFSIAACKKSGADGNVKIQVSISAITPDTGSYGTQVTIIGKNFSQLDAITINGMPCQIQKQGTDTLIISIPKGAGSGPVTIVVGGDTIVGPNFHFRYTNKVITVAGSFQTGNADGPGAQATFGAILDIVLDKDENVYTCEYSETPRIRKVSPAGIVMPFCGSGQPGYLDGAPAAAMFQKYVDYLVTDHAGNIYASDRYNNRIRKITPVGVVSTFVGDGNTLSKDGVGTSASINSPGPMFIDSNDAIYVFDFYNTLRKITKDGTVTSYPKGLFVNPLSNVCVDKQGNLFVIDSFRLKKMDPNGVITTMAGNGTAGTADGIGTNATLSGGAMAMDRFGNLYLAEYGHGLIRMATRDGRVTTLAGTGHNGFKDGPAEIAEFATPGGMAITKEGDIYIADCFNYRIRKLIIQ